MQPGGQVDLSLNPWTTIWWRPQAAINAVLHRRGRSYTLVLAALAGIGTMIGVGSAVSYLHWIAVLAAAVLIGPFLSLLELYIEGALLSWTGRLLGGRASQRPLRTAIAWAALPNVAALAIMCAGLAAYHQDFLRAYAEPAATQDPFLAVLLLVVTALSLWGLFLRIRTVGAVQQFGVARSVANVAASALILLVVVFSARSLLFEPFAIPAASMAPSLLPGDYVFVDKRSYGYSRYSLPFDAGFSGRLGSALPERGDIVVFKLPSDRKTDYVKRVIGLPGDEIEMERGVLRINGAPVRRQSAADITASGQAVPAFEETLPGGRAYTVLDSEPDGPFDNVKPVKVAPGHYFVMGDNRDNSMDSRAVEQVGLVPAENIIGRVSLIYASAGEPRDTESLAGAFVNIRWHRIFDVPK